MSRLKVFLIAPPFSGHLHPLLGIGMRLQESADVTVLSTPGAAADTVLPFQPILGQHERTVWAIAEPGQDVKSNPRLLYRQLKANISLLAELRAELLAHMQAQRPHLVLADFTVPVAGLAAQQLGIPWWTTLPSPCVFETPDGPPAYMGGLFPAQNGPQRLLHAVLRLAVRGFKLAMGRLFRQELSAIGFPGIYRADGYEAIYSPQRILALGMRELEFPRTYPAHFEFAGPVLHTPHRDSPAPHFHRGASPHVLITLGTHLPHAKAKLAAVMRRLAARHPHITFHFTHGLAAHAASPTQDTSSPLQEYAHISYAEHLHRYSLVIHHAGSGILNYCLRHGIPSVVIPQDYDQFDNAARLVAHGLAHRVYALDDLETTLLHALHDPDLKARCTAMQRLHSQQDGARYVAQQVQAQAPEWLRAPLPH